MVNLNCYLHDDNKTKEELVQNIEIKKASYQDAYELISLMVKTFQLPSKQEALHQFLETDALLDESVKLVDKRDNKIYGFLIFSNMKIANGSPISYIYPMLNHYLNGVKQINGFAFVIDKRLRGCGLDKKMLTYNMDFLKQYDFIWCGVERELKSHSYWKRLGFEEILEIPQAKFYINTLQEKPMNDIFIIKALMHSFENEGHIKRTRSRHLFQDDYPRRDERPIRQGFDYQEIS